MVTRLTMQGRTIWFKTYPGGSRRLRLIALDIAARWLGIPALRPPPHHVGPARRDTERRRLLELAAKGVRVPAVVGEQDDGLLLSDIGQTLSAVLRNSSPLETREIAARAARALAEVHVRGSYIGQPFARNITVDDHGQIGFIDFEEDPAEVMGITQAQVRDWLLFAAGTSKYFVAENRDNLAALMTNALQAESAAVRDGVAISAKRLGLVSRVSALMGERASLISNAVLALGATGL